MNSVYTLCFIFGLTCTIELNSTTNQPEQFAKRIARQQPNSQGNQGQIQIIGPVPPPPPPPAPLPVLQPMAPPTISCFVQQHGNTKSELSCDGACTYEQYTNGDTRSLCVDINGLGEDVKLFKQYGYPQCVKNLIPHGSNTLKSICYCFHDHCNEVQWLIDNNCFVMENGVSTTNVFYLTALFIVLIY